MIQKQYLPPVGVILFLAGIGLVFHNVTGGKEWYIGEGLDPSDDQTWVIRDQMIGFATPWSYDLGTLPEGTRIYARFNVTTVETRTDVYRPGLSRHIITDADTGDVLLLTDSPPPSSEYLFKTPRTGHYRYTVQSIRPAAGWERFGQTLDLTPVDFNACIQAYVLVVVYPYRLVGAPLLIVGIAMAAYSKIKK